MGVKDIGSSDLASESRAGKNALLGDGIVEETRRTLAGAGSIGADRCGSLWAIARSDRLARGGEGEGSERVIEEIVDTADAWNGDVEI
jgi:hypothetical protein